MVILFGLVATGIAGWWYFSRQLTAMPWDREQQLADNQHDGASLNLAPPRVGLWILLAVLTSFFSLFMSAYGMRMMLDDWRPLTEPGLLWGNTLILVLASVAFQRTRRAAERGDAAAVKTGLLVAGFSTIAFIAGQLLAWRQLNASGHFLAANAANAFFYLLTGLHAIHLLGGLVIWAKTTVRMWRGESKLGAIRLSVELCTVYWHYLLLVWLVLFALLLTT